MTFHVDGANAAHETRSPQPAAIAHSSCAHIAHRRQATATCMSSLVSPQNMHSRNASKTTASVDLRRQVQPMGRPRPCDRPV
jgi:hypothetical protein